MISREDIEDILIGIEDDVERMKNKLESLTHEGVSSSVFMKYHKKYLQKMKECHLMKILKSDLHEVV